MLDYQEDINFEIVPTQYMTEEIVFDPTRGFDTAALIGDEARIRTLMSEYLQGIWP